MSRFSHYRGAGDAHDTFLVILKVLGRAIHLWPLERVQLIGKIQNFKIACHNVETHADFPGSDIKHLILSDPAPLPAPNQFEPQSGDGQLVSATDMVIFMTGPMDSSRRASYALEIRRHEDVPTFRQEYEFIEEGSENGSVHEKISERIGTAYICLDPGFSTQGTQRIPIIETNDQRPIGQLQVDYLIVTNPVGYGVPRPEPEWLFNYNRPLIAGHRGSGAGRRDDLPGTILENTIASFKHAHQNGADVCELDVLVTHDGIPVVYHDFDVDAVTAQKDSEKLGKFRVQVDEFTMKQLKDFRLVSMSDEEGHSFTLAVENQAEDNKPFPALAQVLHELDESCGMSIEVKWPQALVSGNMEARKNKEINDFVERIIEVVSANAHGRRVILESFDPDLTILLRLKQTKFPVVFLTQGLTKRYENYSDFRSRSVRNAIYFACAFGFAGIDLIMDYYMLYGKQLVDIIHSHGLVARTWGELICGHKTLEYLRCLGLQCITYDKVDLVNQCKQSPQQNDCNTSDIYSKQIEMSQASICEEDRVGVTVIDGCFMNDDYQDSLLA